MTWTEHVYNYCERGHDPAIWAEPLNAGSNLAFLLAAAAAGVMLRRTGAGSANVRSAVSALIVLVGIIGAGSFVFHTFATRWALLADVGPITLFMIAYLAHALRRFVGLGWLVIGTIEAVFLASGMVAGAVTCDAASAVAAPEPCFNGSLGYVPALASLAVVGSVAWQKSGSRVGRPLLIASGVFLVSLVLRTVDLDWCRATILLGRPRGTHALWHTLNAVTLYLLLVAAIRHLEQEMPDQADRTATTLSL